METEKPPVYKGGILHSKYVIIHRWIKAKYGKAMMCEHCHQKDKKQYEWALKKGYEYDKNIENFIQLCSSCHRKYDETDTRRAKISKAQKGRLPNNIRAVVKMNKEDEELEEYTNALDAANSNNMLRTSISNCLNKRTETAGGFKWKYKKEKK